MVDTIILFVGNSGQVKPPGTCCRCGHSRLSGLAVRPEPQQYRLWAIKPFRLRQKDHVRLFGKHVFGRKLTPVFDLSIGDIYATNTMEYASPHAATISFPDRFRAILRELDVDFLGRRVGLLNPCQSIRRFGFIKLRKLLAALWLTVIPPKNGALGVTLSSAEFSNAVLAMRPFSTILIFSSDE